MKKVFELTELQIFEAIDWKEEHVRMQKKTGLLCARRDFDTLQVVFPENANYARVMCTGCNESMTLFPFDSEPPKSRRTDPIGKRLFTQELSMNSGSSTSVGVDRLHQRLDYALKELTDNQQNGGIGHGYIQDLINQSEDRIDGVLEDLIMALGAHERFKRT